MTGERSELEKLSPLGELPVMPPASRPGPSVISYTDLASYSHGNGTENDSIHLRDLWHTVRKRKWLVIVIAIVVTTIATIEVYRTKSIYQASATIEIGKDHATLVKSGDVVIQTDDSDSIKTKMLMLKSRPLLEDVVIDLKLALNPKFLDIAEKKSLWEALKTISDKLPTQDQVQVPQDAVDTTEIRPDKGAISSPAETTRLAPFVDILEKNLTVEQIPDTRALTISFMHTDPVIAASVANGIAQDFIRRSFQSKTEKFTNTSAWLDRSTRELKAKVEQAEQALANYSREHNIFSTEGSENLSASKLASLHDQVTRAETDRILKQSLYEEVKAGRVAQLPQAFADPKIAELEKKLGELTVMAAQIEVKYGPENPRFIEIQQQMVALQKQIDSSRRMLEEKLKADYERAVRDERLLRASLEQAKSEAVQQNQAAIQYNILKQELETTKALYTDFLDKTNQANVQVAEQHSNIRVIESAQVPTVPIGPKRLRAILIGLFLSLAVGVGLAFFFEYLDNTIKTVEDVTRYVQLPTLGVIPAVMAPKTRLLSAKRNGKHKAIASNGSNGNSNQFKPGQLMALDDRSSAAEAYRALRTSVLLSAAGGPPKTILVTSGQPGEGKTTTTVNTAMSLAYLGASVLIIDADLRKPTVHKVFGVSCARGLSTYLSREVEIDHLIQKLQIANLSLLPCGPIPPNPAELIGSGKMRNMLRVLAERYDHILIDSPPLISVTDPVILSTLVDGVMLVVQGGKSKRNVVRHARQELSRVRAKIFGIVLNNVDLRRDGYDDYYYYRCYSSYRQDLNQTSVQSSEETSAERSNRDETTAVDLFLVAGTNPNAKKRDDSAAVVNATFEGHADTAQALENKDVSVNAEDNGSHMALMRAAFSGDAETVMVLLDKGADVNARNRNGLTALMIAAAQGQAEIVQALLGRGADVNARYKDGRTALAFAASRGHSEIVQLLRNAGAKELVRPDTSENSES